MSSVAIRHIEWSTAEIRDATLTVGLTGDAEKGWVKRFQGVLAMLQHGGAGWGDIKVSKESIRVADVQEGAAEDLRQLLEGVLQQLNADAGGDALAGTRDEQRPDPHAEADLRLLMEFRSFARDG